MRALWTAVFAAAALVAGGCGSMGPGASAPGPCTLANATPVASAIEITGQAFVPSCAMVAAGATITFTNADGVQHTVTSDAGQPETFDSGFLNPGQQFVHVFASAGTEHVHCNVHSNMHLTVLAQ